MKSLISLLALAGVCVPAGAQPPVRPENPPVRLNLSPSAAPVPTLKYRLLPEVRDLKPGNAAFLYNRASTPEWQTYRRSADLMEKIDRESEEPGKEIPAELRPVLGSAMLREVDLAARRAYCDWELIEPGRKHGLGLLIPEIQFMREFGKLLKLRARMELQEGHFSRAITTLQTGLALGRHVSDGPTLIQALVWVAVSHQILQEVEDWIQRPDAPNLYWALTDLPVPLIDLRKPLQGERLLMDSLFPGFRDALADPSAPLPAADTSFQTVFRNVLTQLGGDLDGQAGLVVVAVREYARAKQFLIDLGRPREQVEALPPLEAVFLYEVHLYDVSFDETARWANLPYAQAQPRREAEDRKFRQEVGDPVGRRGVLPRLLLPAIQKVYQATARLDRRVAALRCVEALRLYAAGHGGKLPASLKEIQEVPIPPDPMTGKEFDYRRTGEDTATLSAPTPPGLPLSPDNTLRYELTLRP